jgi:ActR/RegA family two-component response regulator
MRLGEPHVAGLRGKKVVLVLDDEPGVRYDLSHWLSLKEFTVHTAAAVEDAKRIIESGPVDFAIVDLKVDFRSEIGGAEILHYLKLKQPQAQTLVLSAHDVVGEVDVAIKGMYDKYISKGGQDNYIRTVLATLDALVLEQRHRSCFVIMPFSKTKTCRAEEWTEIYENIIKPAVEGSGFDYRCRRSDALAGNIIEDVLDHLNRAELVIADLTDRNPNVFYELGVRHALRRGTVLITQRIAHVPFDLRPYAIQEYRWRTEPERIEFNRRMRAVLEELEVSPDRGLSPVLKFLGKD